MVMAGVTGGDEDQAEAAVRAEARRAAVAAEAAAEAEAMGVDEAGLGAAWEKLCDHEGMLRWADHEPTTALPRKLTPTHNTTRM